MARSAMWSTSSRSAWGSPWAHFQNEAGRYVAPDEQSGWAALAANVKEMPQNLRLFLPDPESEESYPIVTFSWLASRRSGAATTMMAPSEGSWIEL